MGKVVAIGRPGEKLPPIGVRRLYVADSTWQEVVIDLMRRARAVVIRPGPGEALLWEMNAAVNFVHPRRILIALGHPGMPRKDVLERYRQFKASIGDNLPEGLLPNDPGYGYFIVFDWAWRTQLKRERPAWYSRLRKLLLVDPASILVAELRPLCERIGVRGKPRKHHLRKYVLSCTLAVILGVIAQPVLERLAISLMLTEPAMATYEQITGLEEFRDLSTEEQWLRIHELSQNGIMRLSDEALLTYWLAKTKALMIIGTEACAASFYETPNLAHWWTIFSIDAKTRNAIFSTILMAAMAQIRQQPDPKYADEEQVRAARRAVLKQIPQSLIQILAIARLSRQSRLSDEQVCIAERAFTTAYMTLEEPLRSAGVRGAIFDGLRRR